MSKTIFEKIISEISRKDAELYLKECMSLDPKKVQKAPVRYRVIALAFMKRMSLKELNEKLIESGNETLYARNFWEASLIYAFSHQISYEIWQKIVKELAALPMQEVQWFQDKKCSFLELERFVQSNSAGQEDALQTVYRTRLLEERMKQLSDENARFLDFMKENIQEFSQVREKVRYYFCKYLYYYMKQKAEDYLEACRQGKAAEHYSDLTVFKGISELGRKKYTEEEVRQFLKNATLSFGGIYDAFNDFYFDYISADWMEVMLEYYGNIDALPNADKKRLAESLRVYNREWEKLGDREIIRAQLEKMKQQEMEKDEAAAASYQIGRSGEKSVRNYVKGALDIDRTTLVCYLLFFNHVLDEKHEGYVTRGRMDHILHECHLPVLRESDPFDDFVIHFIDSENPEEELMDSIAFYAFEQKNSFLYHMYNESISNEQTIRKVMGI